MRQLQLAVTAALVASQGCATSPKADDGNPHDLNPLDAEIVAPNSPMDSGSAAAIDTGHHEDVPDDRYAGDTTVLDASNLGDAGDTADAAGDVLDTTVTWKVIQGTCSGVVVPVAPSTATYEGLQPVVYSNGCSSSTMLRLAAADASPAESYLYGEGLLGGLLAGWYFALGPSQWLAGESWLEGVEDSGEQHCFDSWSLGAEPPWFVHLGPGPGFDYRDGYFFEADGTFCTSGVGVRWARLPRELPCPMGWPDEVWMGVEVGGTYPCGPAVQALAALSKDDVLILWRRKPFLPTREIVKFTFGVAEPTPWTFEGFPEGHRLTDMKRGHDDLIYLGFIDADWTKHRGHVRSYTHDGKLVSISPTVPGWVAGVSAAKNGDIYAGTNHGPIFWIRKSDGQVVPLSGTYCTETFTGAIDVIEVAP